MKIKDFLDNWQDNQIKDSEEIQRNLVWGKKFKTELIESIMHQKPIGAITLFKTTGNNFWEIIDGKQRVYALESFNDNNLSFGKKTIDSLTEEEKNLFYDYELTIQYAEGTFKDKCLLFEKINTNLVPLKPFELLRAQFYGDFIEGLQKFVKDSVALIAISKGKTKMRGENELLVLDIVRKQLTRNDFLKLHQHDSFVKYRALPTKILDFIVQVFTNYPSGDLTILITLAQTYENHKTDLYKNQEKLNNDIINMREAIHFEGWDKLSQYERILDRYIIEKDPRRIFPKEIKDHLWNLDSNHLCQLCLQVIDNYNDAEVDHKMPWSKGGLTNLENGQIAHQTCNRRKGNR